MTAIVQLPEEDCQRIMEIIEMAEREEISADEAQRAIAKLLKPYENKIIKETNYDQEKCN